MQVSIEQCDCVSFANIPEIHGFIKEKCANRHSLRQGRFCEFLHILRHQATFTPGKAGLLLRIRSGLRVFGCRYMINRQRQEAVFVIRTIVTVIGVDTVGIIARVATLLAQRQVNILDINQTVMQEFFTMVMMVDVAGCNVPFETLKADLAALGQEMGMTIHVQREEIFQTMHRI